MSKRHQSLLNLEGNELNMRIKGKNKVMKHINKYRNKKNIFFKFKQFSNPLEEEKYEKP